MRWIYLSPHFDDAIYSCGGYIFEQIQAGEIVEVWTICAGAIPTGDLSPFAQKLHTRWKLDRNVVQARALEDKDACRKVYAKPKHLDLPDCIYRRDGNDQFIINSESDLLREVPRSEHGLINFLTMRLRRLLQEGDQLVSPFAVGGHIDHRLTRISAESTGYPLYYYADYPYSSQKPQEPMESLGAHAKPFCREITPAGLTTWRQGASAYVSQMTTFWVDTAAMNQAFSDYLSKGGGTCLWKLVR